MEKWTGWQECNNIYFYINEWIEVIVYEFKVIWIILLCNFHQLIKEFSGVQKVNDFISCEVRFTWD